MTSAQDFSDGGVRLSTTRAGNFCSDEFPDLQEVLPWMSPREGYHQLCTHANVKYLKAVSALLPGVSGGWGLLTTLDVSRTYVGAKGIRPLVGLCRYLPNLNTFNASDNHLSNESVWHLTRMALTHPALSSIDVSENLEVSWTGGMALLELASRNKRMTGMVLHGTTIKPDIVEAIFATLRANSARRQSLGSPSLPEIQVPRGTSSTHLATSACTHDNWSSERMQFIAQATEATTKGADPHSPSPAAEQTSQHYRSVCARALRQLFWRLQRKGVVPPAALVEGYNELLYVLGKQNERAGVTAEDLEALIKRAPVDEPLVWDAFLVLLMMEGSQYDSQLVESLQSVFREFSRSDPRTKEPLIDVSELRWVMMRLYGKLPSEAEVAAKRAYLDLHDGQVLHWDDFLLLFYDRGPEVVCDPLGSLWCVSKDRTSVYVYPSATAEEELIADGVDVSTELDQLPILECREGDRVCTIVFAGPARGIASGPPWACVVTTCGCLYIARTLNPFRELLSQSDLDSHVVAACSAVQASLSSSTHGDSEGGLPFHRPSSTGGAIAAPRSTLESQAPLGTSSPGADSAIGARGVRATEVNRDASLFVACQAESTTEVVAVRFTASHSSDPGTTGTTSSRERAVDVADGVNEQAEVEAEALFEVDGHVLSLISTQAFVITVNDRGVVDVWDRASGGLVSQEFGSMAYDSVKLGRASCPAIVHMGFLWLGTDRGHLILFEFRRTDGKERSRPCASPRVLRRCHEGPIHSLLAMSLGQHVWSSELGGNRCLCVWNAHDTSYVGSLTLSPEDDVAHLTHGPAVLESFLWGIDAANGLVRSLNVREIVNSHCDSSLRSTCSAVPDRGTVAGPRSGSPTVPLNSLAVHDALDALVTHMCTVLQASEDTGGGGPAARAAGPSMIRARSGSPPEWSAPLTVEQTEARLRRVAPEALQRYPAARHLPDAILSLVTSRRMFEQAYRELGWAPSNFVEDVHRTVTELLAYHRHAKELACYYPQFVVQHSEANRDKYSPLLPVSGKSSQSSSGTLGHIVRDLKNRVAAPRERASRSPDAMLQRPHPSAAPGSNGDVLVGLPHPLHETGSTASRESTSAVARSDVEGSPAPDQHLRDCLVAANHPIPYSDQLRELSAARSKAELQVEQLNARMRDLLRENEEASDAVRRLESQLAASEERCERVERSLITARKAADAVVDQVSAVVEMEAQLHDAKSAESRLKVRLEELEERAATAEGRYRTEMRDLHHELEELRQRLEDQMQHAAVIRQEADALRSIVGLFEFKESLAKQLLASMRQGRGELRTALRGLEEWADVISTSALPKIGAILTASSHNAHAEGESVYHALREFLSAVHRVYHLSKSISDGERDLQTAAKAELQEFLATRSSVATAPESRPP